MANTDKTGRTNLTRGQRWLLAAAAVGLLMLLTTAAWLKPSPLRHGTHQQLGLPPCTFWVLFGRPCPTCGMTTAWAHLVRGQVIGALRTNVGGTLLAVVAAIAVPWLLGSAARGRWLGMAPNGAVAACISTTILLVILIHWLIRLLT